MGGKYMYSRFSEDYGIIDSKTGELITAEKSGGFTVISEEMRRLWKNKEKKRNSAYADDLKEFGNFFWGLYKVNEPYLDDIAPSTITRLIYLATFLSYDGSLRIGGTETEVVNGRRFDVKRVMTKEDMIRKMMISERAFYYFFDEIAEKGVLYEKDGVFYLNKEFFTRGELAIKKNSDTFAMKMYISAIRAMYDNAVPSSHKSLSYVFRAIPFVNRRYNTVCYNPLEEDDRAVRKMCLGDFCDIIGYDKEQSKRLFKTLLEPEFRLKNGMIAPIMRFVVTHKEAKKEDYYMFFNPHVFYGGRNTDDVKALGIF